MAIGGQIKIFDNNFARKSDSNVSITVSTGTGSGDFAIDRNSNTYWTSVGSDDTTTETLIVEFASTAIDRIFLIDHNFKDYTVEYDVSGVWTDFSTVVGLDGSSADITETAYARGTSYYEFDSVTTTKIRVSVTKSQIVDAEKFINRIVVTAEIDTLEGYPIVQGLSVDRNVRAPKMLSGKRFIMKSEQSFKVALSFKNYPPSLGGDLDTMFDLFDRDDNFMIWLCGGKFSTTVDFRYINRGFRLEDLFTVQIPKKLSPKYRKNVYTSMVNLKVSFEEAVD